jgi:hypothetical protein
MLELEIQKNTAAINLLIETLNKFKVNTKPAHEPVAPTPETAKQTVATKPVAPTPEPVTIPKESPVQLSDIQEVVKTFILMGGEAKERARQIVEDIGGVGMKTRSLPEHENAAVIMPQIYKALKDLEKELK